MAAQAGLLGKKTLCLVSGASRGIGRATALALAQKIADGSALIVVARNLNLLTALKAEIARIVPNVSVFPYSTDLSTADAKAYERMFTDVKKHLSSSTSPQPFEVAMAVHNAATIGPIHKKCTQLRDVVELRQYFDMNVVSTILLNTVFLENFSTNFAEKRVVVNISSGAAYLSISGLHLYSAGKAARDGFFRVLSDEEPSIRVLNFNPGPIVTDMQYEIGDKVWNEGVMKWSKDGVEAGEFKSPQVVAEKLCEILQENAFKSGSFVNLEGRVLKFSFEESA